MSICDAGYERCEEYREQIAMLTARIAEAEMLLRQCSAVWHDQGPLPAIIAGFLYRRYP